MMVPVREVEDPGFFNGAEVGDQQGMNQNLISVPSWVIGLYYHG